MIINSWKFVKNSICFSSLLSVSSLNISAVCNKIKLELVLIYIEGRVHRLLKYPVLLRQSIASWRLDLVCSTLTSIKVNNFQKVPFVQYLIKSFDRFKKKQYCHLDLPLKFIDKDRSRYYFIQYHQTLEIKPCRLGPRIRDVEAF